LIATDEEKMVGISVSEENFSDFGVPLSDMKKQFVYDPLVSKRQQYLLATQVCDNKSPLADLLLTLSHF
jgi:hypothetical protein